MQRAVAAPNSGARPEEFVAFAVDLETAGWDGLFVYDHLHLDPSLGLDIYDPWVLLAAVAQATERIVIGTAVTPISRRRPWKLAREIVTLDHLSGGRAVVGIGLGGFDEHEYAAFGDDSTARDRTSLTDEALELLDAFLRGDAVDHRGPHFTVNAHLLPAARQSPRPPIWIAATHPYRGSRARAARWDGIFCNVKVDAGFAPLTPEEVRSYVGDLVGRPNFDVVTFHHPDHEPQAYADAGVTWLVEALGVSNWLGGARDRFLNGP